MKFISLDADDVIYQDGAANYLTRPANTAPETTTIRRQIPNGTVTYNRGYTGNLSSTPRTTRSCPTTRLAGPNLQTLWLEGTLAEARRDPSVDMIVVFMHQCAMSTSVPGNGSDLGIRQAWLPLFDKYEVDLVLSGHEHDYERTYPVRGYDAGEFGTVVPLTRARRWARRSTPAARRWRPPSLPAQRHPGLEHRRRHGLPGARRRRHQRPDQLLRHRHRR